MNGKFEFWMKNKKKTIKVLSKCLLKILQYFPTLQIAEKNDKIRFHF